MAVVYLARYSRLEFDVAITALPEHLAVDPDRLTRFERETKTPSEYGDDDLRGRQTMSTALGQCDPVPLRPHDRPAVCATAVFREVFSQAELA
jgi:hypothetical protein